MNTIFIIISILLFLSLLTGSLYFYKHENRFVRARSVTIGAILMTIYSIFSLWALLNSSIPAKPVLFICGISPFIIGHYATYKKLFIYTILQLTVIAAGILYTITSGLI